MERNGGGIARLTPPEKGFYSKLLDFHGIPIKAHADIADEALFEARSRIWLMLRQIPEAIANLRDAGSEFLIIGKDQVLSDLPDYLHHKGKKQTRGLGSRVASCGEENLLRLPNDPYHYTDICIHEFAHTLLDFGLSPEIRLRIRDQYRRSLSEGLWRTTYAETNEHEFFAELSTWYFGLYGHIGKLSPRPGRGSRWLRRYDPQAYELLEAVYAGEIPIERFTGSPWRVVPLSREGIAKSYKGLATSLCFENHSPFRMELFWIDYMGRRKTRGTILPHGRRAVKTFSSHPWVVVSERGQPSDIVVTGTKPGTVPIGPLPEPSKGPIPAPNEGKALEHNHLLRPTRAERPNSARSRAGR